MPTLDQHPSNRVVKMLVVGDSGAGKTGGLASLVDAGFKLRVLDIGQDGLDPLIGYVQKRDLLKNVDYESIKDTYGIAGSRVKIEKAPTFQQVMASLNKWPSDGKHVKDWDPQTVLVIDALSTLGRASLNMVLAANGFIDRPPEIQHWGTAMENLEKVLANVTNAAVVPCHLVMLTHITYQEDAGGAATKAFPEALGTKLNPKVARYFNNMVSLSVSAGERSYKTKRDGLVICKTSRAIKEKYPIATGMAEMFKDLLG